MVSCHATEIDKLHIRIASLERELTIANEVRRIQADELARLALAWHKAATRRGDE